MDWTKRRIKEVFAEKDIYHVKIIELEKDNLRLINNCTILEECNNKAAEMLEELHKEIRTLKDIDVKKSIELVQLKEEKEKLLNKISWLENENDRLSAKALRWDLSNL